MCCSPNPSPQAVSPGEGPWTRGPSFLSCVVDVPSSPLSARPFTPNDLGHRSALLLAHAGLVDRLREEPRLHGRPLNAARAFLLASRARTNAPRSP